MSSRRLTILCPNGHQQIVKCTVNTAILEILDAVCRKLRFIPERYDLRHQNKVLDIAMPFRLLGLPNNAHLELVRSLRGNISFEVILALYLEDVRRIFGHFLPETTLYNVLKRLCPKKLDGENHPVLIYMGRPIYGVKLQTMTLRCLGLRGGRAVFRLVNKSPHELKTQAYVGGHLRIKSIEEEVFISDEERELLRTDIDLVEYEISEDCQQDSLVDECDHQEYMVETISPSQECGYVAAPEKPINEIFYYTFPKTEEVLSNNENQVQSKHDVNSVENMVSQDPEQVSWIDSSVVDNITATMSALPGCELQSPVTYSMNKFLTIAPEEQRAEFSEEISTSIVQVHEKNEVTSDDEVIPDSEEDFLYCTDNSDDEDDTKTDEEQASPARKRFRKCYCFDF